MAWVPEAMFALATTIVLLPPTSVVWLAYKRVRSPRLLLAALGFTVFLLAEISVFLDQTGSTPAINETEVVEFIGDAMTAALFAAAFLWPKKRLAES